MTTIHTRQLQQYTQLTTIHTRHLKIQHVQEVYSRPVSKHCPVVMYEKIDACFYSPCRVIVIIIMDMMMLVMVLIGGDVIVFQMSVLQVGAYFP